MVNYAYKCKKSVTKLHLIKGQKTKFPGEHASSLPHALHTDTYLPPLPPLGKKLNPDYLHVSVYSRRFRITSSIAATCITIAPAHRFLKVCISWSTLGGPLSGQTVLLFKAFLSSDSFCSVNETKVNTILHRTPVGVVLKISDERNRRPLLASVLAWHCAI